MKKIFISISMIVAFTTSCSNNYEKEIIVDETIGWIQDMREWMVQDIENGVIPLEYGEYYVMGLEHCEDRLVTLDSLNK